MKELVTHVMSLCCTSAQTQTTLFQGCSTDIAGDSKGFPGRPILDLGSNLSFSTQEVAGSFVSSSSTSSSFGYAFNFREVSISTISTQQNSAISSCKDFLFRGPLPVVVKDNSLVSIYDKAHLTWSTPAGQNHTSVEIQKSFYQPRFKTLSLILDGNPATGKHAEYKHRDELAWMRERKLAGYRMKPVREDGGFTFRKMMSFSPNTNSASAVQIATNLFAEKINWKFKSSTGGKKWTYEI